MVWRLRHHAMVRRSLVERKIRHLHGGEDAGARASAESMDVLLPTEQASRLRRRRHGWHDTGLAAARESRSGEEQLRRNRLQQSAWCSEAAELPGWRLG